MAKTNVISLSGEKVKDITLNDNVWNITPNETVLTFALNLQMSSLRQGTAKTKNRAEVSGGGKKPWRQKGTGRARQGSIRSPQWRGGGIVFGPTPRSYDKKQNRKERILALKSALSMKYQDKELIVVDSLALNSNKTKDFVNTLKGINAKNALIVTSDLNENLLLATSNNQNVYVIGSNEINVLDLVRCESLVIDEASVNKIEEAYK